jgi:hypothetical protein
MENTDQKRERFIRVAERRVNKLLSDFDRLSKCADAKNYTYSEDDIKRIFSEIEKKLREIKALFKYSKEKRKQFKLVS